VKALRAIILAGGYAKRMGRLTAELPKSLLPSAGRPAIDRILDKVNEVAPAKILLTTDLRFKLRFESWLTTKESPNIEIVAEESRSEDEKLWAVGALVNLVPTLEPDHYLVIYGHNIFTLSLAGMLPYY
jgi:glucose-1-phosphate thymidylyltransferase